MTESEFVAYLRKMRNEVVTPEVPTDDGFKPVGLRVVSARECVSVTVQQWHRGVDHWSRAVPPVHVTTSTSSSTRPAFEVFADERVYELFEAKTNILERWLDFNGFQMLPRRMSTGREAEDQLVWQLRTAGNPFIGLHIDRLLKLYEEPGSAIGRAQVLLSALDSWHKPDHGKAYTLHASPFAIDGRFRVRVRRIALEHVERRRRLELWFKQGHWRGHMPAIVSPVRKDDHDRVTIFCEADYMHSPGDKPLASIQLVLEVP